MKRVSQPGGTTEQEDAVTGAVNQIRIDEVRHEIRIHDGVTQGGHRIPTLESIETLISGGNTSGTGVGVVQLFGSVNDLKAAVPNLNMLAILTLAGSEDAFVWHIGAGTNADIPSDVNGHWSRVSNEAGLIIALYRAGLINLQIEGTQPIANMTTTAWLTGGAVKMWDGTNYLDATPVLFGKLLAAVGGYYTGAAALPNRILAQSFEITNLDTVVESGWYKSHATATGAPVAGVHSFEHRELTGAIAIQMFYLQGSASRAYYVRFRTASTPTWGSWALVDGTLPARLAATTVAVADADTYLTTGWYTAAAATANMPTTAIGYVMVIQQDANNICQIAVMNDGAIYRRVRAAGTWGAWLIFSLLGHTHDDRYFTETEINTMFSAYYTASQLNSGQLDSRYYTESETNSLLAGKTDVSSSATVGSIAILGASGSSSVVRAMYGVYGGNLFYTAIDGAGMNYFTGAAATGTWRFLGGVGKINETPNTPLGLYQKVS